MRRLSMLLLLATAAAPAFAAPGEEGDRPSRRDRTAASDQSESRPQRAFPRESSQSEQRRFGVQRSERPRPAEQGTTESIRERFQQHLQQRQEQAATAQPGSDQPIRRWRRGDGDGSGATQSEWRPRERQVRTIPDANVARQHDEQTAAFRDRRRSDYRNGNYSRWSTSHWRKDHRYDWRRWRDRHRSIFRLGFYYDPFGWSYRRWSLGSYLWPSYYGSRYWLNDPWHYRLPPAYGPYRWVRYWDDALLVNIYTGQVVDVIHNFFW